MQSLLTKLTEKITFIIVKKKQNHSQNINIVIVMNNIHDVEKYAKKKEISPNLSCKLFLFYCPILVGHVAQLVEQLTFNQLVEGSNPSVPTNTSIIYHHQYYNNLTNLNHSHKHCLMGDVDCSAVF